KITAVRLPLSAGEWPGWRGSCSPVRWRCALSCLRRCCGGWEGRQHRDDQASPKHLLKRLSVFLYPPDFHLTIMRGVDTQHYMSGINGVQLSLLDEAGMATIEVFCQAQEDAHHPYNLLRARVKGGKFQEILHCRR